jgi:hypothetical protein
MAHNPKYEGIIIIGTPRSGTTLLRRILNAHPNIACPGETNLFSACARFLHSESIAEGVEIGVLPGLGYAGFNENEVLQRLREFAFSFHREHAHQQGKSRWAEKTAFDSFYLEAIERFCGDHAYFICVQRHGLDVACSLQELCDKNGGYLSELHEYIKRYPRPLEAFGHVWVDLTEAIRQFAQRHPKNALVIRYEDLTADSAATMQTIAEFIGEEWQPQWLERAIQKPDNLGLGDWKTYSKSQIDTASVERWRNLSRATISMLGKICNPTLKACGYPLVEVIEERSSEEARRRYELGLMINAMRVSKKQP